MNVAIQPELLRWARTRADLSVEELARHIGTKNKPAPLQEWEAAEKPVQIPVRVLERLAQITRAPYGMLFLPAPPTESLPVIDFRHAPRAETRRFSLQLLETVRECQLRQEWLSEVLKDDGELPLAFIRSASLQSNPLEVAADIRETLRIGTAERRQCRKNDLALWIMERLDQAGITAVRKGYAGSSTRRTLYPEEFKGFALADPYAPFIFVNANDWPSSQVFTLAHECAHLWLGFSAVPNGEWFSDSQNPVERFCNQVAAETLIPAEELVPLWMPSQPADANAQQAAKHFRVSSLAVLYRARNLGLVTMDDFSAAIGILQQNFDAKKTKEKQRGGGDYYNNAKVHLGARFLTAVLARTLEGSLLYTDAFELLGTKKTEVVHRLARKFLWADQ